MNATPKAKTDGDQAKAPFDPYARFIDHKGLSYKDFGAYLTGCTPDEGDRANANIERYLREGRSEAFCRVFRQGYDAHFGPHDEKRSTPGYTGSLSEWATRQADREAHAKAHAKGFIQASDPLGNRRPDEIASTPHNRAVVRAFGAATLAHPAGYHEC